MNETDKTRRSVAVFSSNPPAAWPIFSLQIYNDRITFHRLIIIIGVHVQCTHVYIINKFVHTHISVRTHQLQLIAVYNLDFLLYICIFMCRKNENDIQTYKCQ